MRMIAGCLSMTAGALTALSPKDTTDGVWKALRATAGALVCN